MSMMFGRDSGVHFNDLAKPAYRQRLPRSGEVVLVSLHVPVDPASYADQYGDNPVRAPAFLAILERTWDLSVSPWEQQPSGWRPVTWGVSPEGVMKVVLGDLIPYELVQSWAECPQPESVGRGR